MISVTIATPVGSNPTPEFLESVSSIQKNEFGFEFILKLERGPLIDKNRNKLLKNINTDYVWMLDDDTGFTYSDFSKLHAHNLNVVFGAVKYIKAPLFHNYGYYVPGYKGNFLLGCVAQNRGLVRADWCGSASILMKSSWLHSDVVQKVYPWFWHPVIELPPNSETQYESAGEDIGFCFNLDKLGVPIMVETSVNFCHIPRNHGGSNGNPDR